MQSQSGQRSSYELSFYLIISRTLAIIVATVAFVVLLGWSIPSTALIEIFSYGGIIAPEAALCFLLISLSLLLFCAPGRTAWRCHISNASAIIAVGFGLYALMEYFLNLHFFIDEWLFPNIKLIYPTYTLARQLSLICSLNFVLTGLTLLFLNIKKTTQFHQLLNLIVFSFALLALLSHIHNVQYLQGIPVYTYINIPSAVLFLMITIGIFTLTPQSGLMAIIASQTSGGQLARRLLPAAIFIPIILGWLKNYGEHRGLYVNSYGTSLLSVTHAVIFMIFVLVTARQLYKADLERKAALNNLKQAHDELEKRIRERTSELEQANQELKRLNKEKSDQTSMLSHELKTPLAAIRESLSLVLDEILGPLADEQHETLSITKRNVDRLTRMINNILTYEKSDSGAVPLMMHETNMRDLILEVYELMRASIENKKIHFDVELPSSEIYTVCDDDQIRQVLINLLDNARKFTPESGRIRLHLRQWDDLVQIQIQDTGIGIAHENREKIFEMFTQVTYKGIWQSEGSGIGLTVCKQIIERHHGQIDLQSEPGKGTSFIITLPMGLKLSKQERKQARM